MMEITSTSIINFLEKAFKKEKENILLSDLLLIETLTISGKDTLGNKQIVSFQDLKKFQNLKYLEIKNTLITTTLINILSKLNYLENLVIRNCTFSKKITSLENLTNIKKIRLFNCKSFKESLLKDIPHIERIFLSGIKLTNLNFLSKQNLKSLDISESNIKHFTKVEKLNIDNLIINHNQYLNNKKYLDKCKYKIMVTAIDGYYIEKWIN